MFAVDDLRPLFGKAYCQESVMCDAPTGPPGGSDIVDAPYTPNLDRFLVRFQTSSGFMEQVDKLSATIT